MLYQYGCRYHFLAKLARQLDFVGFRNRRGLAAVLLNINDRRRRRLPPFRHRTLLPVNETNINTRHRRNSACVLFRYRPVRRRRDLFRRRARPVRRAALVRSRTVRVSRLMPMLRRAGRRRLRCPVLLVADLRSDRRLRGDLVDLVVIVEVLLLARVAQRYERLRRTLLFSEVIVVVLRIVLEGRRVDFVALVLLVRDEVRDELVREAAGRRRNVPVQVLVQSFFELFVRKVRLFDFVQVVPGEFDFGSDVFGGVVRRYRLAVRDSGRVRRDRSFVGGFVFDRNEVDVTF